jgi:hypothetical protein
MAKSKRTRRARNKIEGFSKRALIKADPSGESAATVHRSNAVRVAKTTTIFTAELEEVIELIAKDRVYRAMLGRRLLISPRMNDDVANP